MADVVDPATRSRMMAGIRGKDTKPELVLRRLLHKLGFRFRLHRRDLPGRPDIVLPKYRTTVFVNGCYWHGHEDCHLFRLPESRREFWEDKIAANRVRDRRVRECLLDAGWKVVDVWECAVTKSRKLSDEELERRLVEAIGADDMTVVIRSLSGRNLP